MRQQTSLAGHWQFQLDPSGELSPATLHPDRTIPVPMPIQAAFPELRRYSGYLWYQRSFAVEALNGEVLLDFGAVDYWCQVFVNDEIVAEHEGGYMPFRISIRKYVHLGENRLTVCVYDTIQTAITIPRWIETPTEPMQPPFNAETIPHGKQTWYLDASGIWQDVTLTTVPVRYIDQVHVTPNIHTGEAKIRVRLAGMPQAANVRVSINAVSSEAPIASDQDEITLTVRIDQPSLWTPSTPTLYTAVVQVGDDSISVRFGFREISTCDGILLLNGEPFYLLCALDQDLYPGTIYTVPSDDFLRDQFLKAKLLGLNSLRCHIKPPDPRYYDLADEIGLLIWSEIPSWRTFYGAKSDHPAAYALDDVVKARAEAILEAMIARDYNHPSLMIWTIVNEDWGTTLLLSEADRTWVAGMVDRCKQLDPTRLVVDNSPCPQPWGLSVHVKSDLDDFHVYTNIPDQAESFEQFVEGLASRPLWSFSLDGDAQRTGHEPLIVSEFGNWGVPSLKQFGGGLPDWADLSGWWSPWDGQAGRAEGLLERFDALGLRALWKDYETFAEATQWHEFRALKYEIETMRRLPLLQGYVITELSDIYWESNGLLDFARGPKAFHERFGQINAEDVIVPHLDRFAYWSDETATARIYASHYSTADWTNAQAKVSQAGETLLQAEVSSVKRGEVRDLGQVRWTFSEHNPSLDLQVENGSVLAQNEVNLLVLPADARRAAFTGETALALHPHKTNPQIESWLASSPPSPANASEGLVEEMDRLPGMGGVMRGSGYHIKRTISHATQLIISDHPSADVLAWVKAGGDLLYLANSNGSPFFWVHGRGGNYGGRWITAWSWLRPEVYKRIPVENPLTLPFMNMMPEAVILGVPMTDPAYHGDFLAGQIAGWVQHPALHTVQFRYGAGRVVMTTYPIRETLHFHPLALAMLHDLVDYLTSDACQPTLKANYS
ncbi:MAG: glycoside hydrolase family 2 TIM barrel-domain containing protein [Anaerolineae bacterium]